MPESSLSVDWGEIVRAVGTEAGWGISFNEWSDAKRAAFHDCVKSGVRKAYSPLDPRTGKGHQWSFLQPTVKITTQTDVERYDLPDDCSGQLIGPLTYESVDSAPREVLLTSGSELAHRRQYDSDGNHDYPRLAAVGTIPPTKSESTRYVLDLWPTPHTALTLAVTYIALPNVPTSAKPWLHGGANFSECVLAHILAAWEERFNDGVAKWKSLAQEKLAAAIAQDDFVQSDGLGYFGDRSDGNPRWIQGRGRVGYVDLSGE